MGDQDIVSPGRPVSSRLQMPGEPRRFSFKMSFNFTSRDKVILRVVSLALWKIINEEDAVLIPKNRGEKFSQRIFALVIFGGGMSRYATTPLIVALSPGHSDITTFHPWLPIAPDKKSFGSRRKNSKSCSDDWHR